MIENNKTEYKKELTADLEKAVVAFLNYREGGRLYIGINNDGETVGVNNPDDVQLKIILLPKSKFKSNPL